MTQRSQSTQKVGINQVLQLVNGLIAFLIFSGFFLGKLAGHPYMNSLTLFLGLMLCLQTFFVLRLKTLQHDPFVLLMVYLLTFFYAFRIFTLLLYPLQSAFERFPYSPSDTNFALLYILIANVFLYSGFGLVRIKPYQNITPQPCTPKRPWIGVVLFTLSIVFVMVIQGNVSEPIARFVNLIFNNFLTPSMVLMVLATYVVVYHKLLPPFFLKFAIFGAATLFVLQTLGFSRSGLLTLLDSLYILVLAVIPALKVRRQFVILCLSILPFLLVFAFSIFAISSTARMVRGDLGVTLGERVELLQTSTSILNQTPQTNLFVGHALSRAGYLDFSAEIIANEARYSEIFNLGYYAKSITDNVLSPGFDIFDTPSVAASLKYIYADLGTASKARELESGHSDQIGIYGEAFALFGVYSLPMLFLLAYALKKAFRYRWTANPARYALGRVFLLMIFYRFFNSFGLDLIIFNLIVMSLSFYLIYRAMFLVIRSNPRNAVYGIVHH